MEDITCQLDIYQIDELFDQLQLVFTCKSVNEQIPFVVNQIFQPNESLIQRSITDLSADMSDVLVNGEVVNYDD
jgi:hypothetical protein